MKLKMKAGIALAVFALATLPATSLQAPRQAAPEIKKPLIYHIGDYLHINASGPRPLLQAIDALQQQYGWVVNYEDPEYAIATGNTAAPASPPHRLRPYATGDDTGSGFSFQFNVGPNASRPPDEERLLTALVEAYNNSGGAAQFQLLRQNNSVDVVGVAVRTTNGEVLRRRPILETPISLSKRSLEVSEALTLISRELSQKRKILVSVSLSADVPGSARVLIGGSTMPARGLLAETLNQARGKLCWRLLYEPGNRSYELTVEKVAE